MASAAGRKPTLSALQAAAFLAIPATFADSKRLSFWLLLLDGLDRLHSRSSMNHTPVYSWTAQRSTMDNFCC